MPYALGDADDHQRDKPGAPDSDDDVSDDEPAARGHRVASELRRGFHGVSPASDFMRVATSIRQPKIAVKVAA